MKTRWLILTGEYPPQSGGVADYTRVVGEALAAAGDEVEVWAPPCEGATTGNGVDVTRMPDHFGPRGLGLLSRRLNQPDPRRIVWVQYVPHAFGMKAMNVPFCAWLLSQRRERVWTMFHEVTFPFERHQPMRHHLLAAVNHGMAAMVARASERTLVSIPAWGKLIKRMVCPETPIDWLPVPSNLTQAACPAMRNGHLRVAHFGTYGERMGPLVREAVLRILQNEPSAEMRLLGRGSESFAAALMAEHRAIASRISATGSLPSGEVSGELTASDVVIQPYPDGASTRRSSLMAALALGRAVVTTEGHLSESIWRESGAVALAPAGDAARIAEEAVALLRDEPRRIVMGERAKSLYDARFDVRHTVAFLLKAAEGRR